MTMKPKTPRNKRATSSSIQKLFECLPNPKECKPGKNLPCRIHSFLCSGRQSFTLGEKINAENPSGFHKNLRINAGSNHGSTLLHGLANDLHFV
jgi:hypothetical protein